VICNLSLSILVATHPSIFLLVAVSLRSQSGFRGSGLFRRCSPMYLIASMRSMVCSWFAPLSSILVATHLLSFFWLPRRALTIWLSRVRGVDCSGDVFRCTCVHGWEAPSGVAARCFTLGRATWLCLPLQAMSKFLLYFTAFFSGSSSRQLSRDQLGVVSGFRFLDSTFRPIGLRGPGHLSPWISRASELVLTYFGSSAGVCSLGLPPASRGVKHYSVK
jgi:hypothetical protein